MYENDTWIEFTEIKKPDLRVWCDGGNLMFETGEKSTAKLDLLQAKNLYNFIGRYIKETQGESE